jgi:hypothetical protein
VELERRFADLEAEKVRRQRRLADGSGEHFLEVSRVLSQLRSRDVHVRGHEAAHVAAGGGYVRGGATFSYERGPDGQDYAVGGEVGIDASPLPGKPAETAAKMRVVRAAALAPSDPSSADLSIAAEAEAEEIQAEASASRASADGRVIDGRAVGGDVGTATGATDRSAAAAYGAGDSKSLPGSLVNMLI